MNGTPQEILSRIIRGDNKTIKEMSKDPYIMKRLWNHLLFTRSSNSLEYERIFRALLRRDHRIFQELKNNPQLGASIQEFFRRTNGYKIFQTPVQPVQERLTLQNAPPLSTFNPLMPRGDMNPSQYRTWLIHKIKSGNKEIIDALRQDHSIQEVIKRIQKRHPPEIATGRVRYSKGSQNIDSYVMQDDICREDYYRVLHQARNVVRQRYPTLRNNIIPMIKRSDPSTSFVRGDDQRTETQKLKDLKRTTTIGKVNRPLATPGPISVGLRPGNPIKTKFTGDPRLKLPPSHARRDPQSPWTIYNQLARGDLSPLLSKKSAIKKMIKANPWMKPLIDEAERDLARRSKQFQYRTDTGGSEYWDAEIPFGKYKGRRLEEVPTGYLVAMEGAADWISKQKQFQHFYRSFVQLLNSSSWKNDYEANRHRGYVDGLWTSADRDYYRSDYAYGNPRHKMPMISRDQETGEGFDVASQLDPRRKIYQDRVEFYQQGQWMTPRSFRRMWERREKVYDPDHFRSVRNREFYDMLGGVPDVRRGSAIGSWRGQNQRDSYGGWYGEVRSMYPKKYRQIVVEGMQLRLNAMVQRMEKMSQAIDMGKSFEGAGKVPSWNVSSEVEDWYPRSPEYVQSLVAQIDEKNKQDISSVNTGFGYGSKQQNIRFDESDLGRITNQLGLSPELEGNVSEVKFKKGNMTMQLMKVSNYEEMDEFMNMLTEKHDLEILEQTHPDFSDLLRSRQSEFQWMKV